MKPSEVLKQYGWCQGTSALTEKGVPISATSPHATRFCAVGAMDRAHETTSTECYLESMRKMRDHLDVISVSDWNDAPERTKEEVIAAFEAIGE